MRYKLGGDIRHLGICAVMMMAIMAAHADDDLMRLTQSARKASQQLTAQIGGEVIKELDRTGPIRAIVVCKYSAPELASSVSRQTGMRVSRVSLRVRNQAIGDPDAWEQQVLLDFEKRLAKGEKADNMEFAEIVREPAGSAFRYAKAIPVVPACLACHGPVANLSEAVKSQLASEYPFDRAVDYQVGQIRGAISVKKTF